MLLINVLALAVALFILLVLGVMGTALILMYVVMVCIRHLQPDAG